MAKTIAQNRADDLIQERRPLINTILAKESGRIGKIH